MNKRDDYIPAGKWKFDSDVTEVFPDMIARSIPGYTTMRDSVVMVAKHLLNREKGSFHLLDVGCSRGDTIYEILDSVESGVEVRAVGVDSSEDMILRAEHDFRDFDNVHFILADIADVEITPAKYDVITSILTAQFIPLDVRQEFFNHVHTGLSNNGVFIVVEKVLGETAFSQAFLVDIYHKYKSDNGYTDEQIEEKRKALQGVLVPLRASENEGMLKGAGFSNVQRFWQCLNFSGWVAFK